MLYNTLPTQASTRGETENSHILTLQWIYNLSFNRETHFVAAGKQSIINQSFKKVTILLHSRYKDNTDDCQYSQVLLLFAELNTVQNRYSVSKLVFLGHLICQLKISCWVDMLLKSLIWQTWPLSQRLASSLKEKLLYLLYDSWWTQTKTFAKLTTDQEVKSIHTSGESAQ